MPLENAKYKNLTLTKSFANIANIVVPNNFTVNSISIATVYFLQQFFCCYSATVWPYSVYPHFYDKKLTYE